MAKTDFFSGIGFMILGVIVYILSKDMLKMPLGLGPGDYPKVIAVLMIVLGAILAIKSYREKAPEDKAMLYPLGALGRVALFVVLTYVYIRLLPLFGFQWITPIYLGLSMYHFGLRNVKTMTLSSLGVTWALYGIFYGIFDVLLPRFTLF